MTQSRQPRPSKRSGRERSHRGWLRKALLLAAAIAAFGLGIALGLALDQGSGAKGTQTCEHTLRLVTVTVTKH